MANKFVSILKKIGLGFEHGVEKAILIEKAASPFAKLIGTDVAMFNPAAGAAILGGDALADALTAGVGQSEQAAVAFGKNDGTGPTKLALSLTQIEAALMNTPLLKGRTPADLSKFNQAVEDIGGSWADLLNSFSSAADAAPANTAAAAAAVQAVSAPAVVETVATVAAPVPVATVATVAVAAPVAQAIVGAVSGS